LYPSESTRDLPLPDPSLFDGIEFTTESLPAIFEMLPPIPNPIQCLAIRFLHDAITESILLSCIAGSSLSEAIVRSGDADAETEARLLLFIRGAKVPFSAFLGEGLAKALVLLLADAVEFGAVEEVAATRHHFAGLLAQSVDGGVAIDAFFRRQLNAAAAAITGLHQSGWQNQQGKNGLKDAKAVRAVIGGGEWVELLDRSHANHRLILGCLRPGAVFRATEVANRAGLLVKLGRAVEELCVDSVSRKRVLVALSSTAALGDFLGLQGDSAFINSVIFVSKFRAADLGAFLAKCTLARRFFDAVESKPLAAALVALLKAKDEATIKALLIPTEEPFLGIELKFAGAFSVASRAAALALFSKVEGAVKNIDALLSAIPAIDQPPSPQFLEFLDAVTAIASFGRRKQRQSTPSPSLFQGLFAPPTQATAHPVLVAKVLLGLVSSPVAEAARIEGQGRRLTQDLASCALPGMTASPPSRRSSCSWSRTRRSLSPRTNFGGGSTKSTRASG
jgi:hypothetical protein